MLRRILLHLVRPSGRSVVRSRYVSSSSLDSDDVPSRWRRERISSLLKRVAEGTVSPSDAAKQIDDEDLSAAGGDPSSLASFANIDHLRTSRTGFPEAVFGQSKTPGQIAAILDDMARVACERGMRGPILATRVSPEAFERFRCIDLKHGSATYHDMARIISVTPNGGGVPDSTEIKPIIVVATAGTTDLPVAEEAAVTLEAAGGVRVRRIYDVGVAGLHRILGALPVLCDDEVECVIVCAGMDGALPSVIGGLVDVPVVAVPTSVGYGVSLGGVAAALTMLNSCSPGVGVVNIDNGFGGAALAYKIVGCWKKERRRLKE